MGFFHLNCSFFGRNQKKSEKKAIFIPSERAQANSCAAGITAVLVHNSCRAGGTTAQHPTDMNLEH